VAELGIKSHSDLDALINFSGFPEPFYSATQKEKNRWTIAYRSRLIHEDLVSLEQISDLGSLELLMLRLPDLVGSPLSINGLREDLQVSHPTISRWCDVLERMYAIYRIPPFGAPKLRAVKKEQKVYCWDWSLPESPGAKFENFVAGHLLKWCHFMQDTEGREIELRYFRDTDKREVDFVLVERKKPIMFIECKVDQKDSSDALEYLSARFPGVRCVRVGLKKDAHWRTREGIEVMPALSFLSELV
jgi:predicted AAA+ superfamily ATPase